MQTPVDRIVDAIGKGFEMVTTFMKTRQEAYERKMDKNQRKYIDQAEHFVQVYFDPDIDPEKKHNKLKGLRRRMRKIVL